MSIQRFIAVSSLVLCVWAPARAADGPSSGFYGGVTLREQGLERGGMSLGIPANALSRFNVAAVEDASSRALLFGGYRFSNDVAVEASVNSSDSYALRPETGRRGLGVLPTGTSLGLADVQSRSWNLDLFTSWNIYRSLALYGRLGYAQTDIAPSLSAIAINATDPRRVRDGMNYGVGVRYGVTSALGLRLEYGRFGRYAGDIGSSPLESDQVTFGLQFRF
ncbi:MAG: porin family protein [Pseudomonadota bacterium]|nr:porin family protein [Pseudomonadota bacterium]